ncbi:putative RNA-directed DNA polymerase [Arabidopsis thaliana]
MKDYRPISCCNVLYKVISKILANRLKIILPKFISSNQSAFVKDRLLMENLLLATEIIKDYHKETVSPRCAMKIDISKAFDSVQWGFLTTTLQALDFPEVYINWIKVCISTASFSVQVNGELAGYFGSERGFRQGCSLSPYLFVICMNVLSKKIDKAASDKRIDYHPNCKKLNLTHFCFADDLMVFVEGNKKSIENTLEVFEDFAIHSGLKISLEKSTLYMAGLQEHQRDEILQQFPFEYGSLPVRYLGLPLLTRRMTSSDFLPLLEKIKSQISSWSTRTLSFAGRLQLLSLVTFSLTNFWIAAFRLPKACIKEIDKLCSAFLWSGPSLNPKKAKVAWSEVCTPKQEGGLGLRSIDEANKVQKYLIRDGSFWSIKGNTTRGSWMWHKILKYRGIAKQFYRVEVNNGYLTSFWFDEWCSMGCLYDKLGERGFVDLGISKTCTMGEVMESRRKRHHRNPVLNLIEEELSNQKLKRNGDLDTVLWKGKNDHYRNTFMTKETWSQIRTAKQSMEEYGGIWFPHSTPKYSFITWLAMRNRLSTGDRMLKWKGNANAKCVFCNDLEETRDHLFFSCPYTYQIWEELTRGLLLDKFTADWKEITKQIAKRSRDQTMTFITRYVFQNTIHSVWRERNNRSHGEHPLQATMLVKTIDKNVKNRLSTLKTGGTPKYEDGIVLWFATRRNQD